MEITTRMYTMVQSGRNHCKACNRFDSKASKFLMEMHQPADRLANKPTEMFEEFPGIAGSDKENINKSRIRF